MDFGLNQYAVYWGSPVPNGRGGFTFAAPVEIECRWEQKTELFISFEGHEERSQAVVWLDQDVDVNGYLWLGRLTALDSSAVTPDDQSGALRIRDFKKVPSISADEYLRKAWL
jgi:hypothetical protein